VNRSERRSAYEIEPKNRFADAIVSVTYEFRPANTVTFLCDVDLTEVEELRGARGLARKRSYTAFVVKAIALALKEFPYANRRVCRLSWIPFSVARLQTFLRCDVAVAIERHVAGAESVAFIDVLRDADELSLDAITERLHELAVSDSSTNKQWRDFSAIISRYPNWISTLLIRLPLFFPSLWVKYRGGAALVSSPAKYGAHGVLGTWSHPLGVSFGLAEPRPVVREGKIVACPTFSLTLNFDRRVMAGAQAARFLRRVVELLEHASTEMDRSPANRVA
jgi:pyruvate/2-oxoglutarate dehydrogenase complex dihydrolipoamide acyltransferase (E2) component